MMSTTTPAVEIPGPIRTLLPRGAQPASVTRLLDNELRGHRTAAGWLDGEAVPELAELAADHARIRGQIVSACLELREREAAWQREDRDHANALRRAVRAGEPESADERTPPEERAAFREQAAETIWPAVEALAQVVREAIAVLADAEDEIMARVRRDYSAAEEKRAEAQRLLREADAEAWHASRIGRWVMGAVDDGALNGAQPFPAERTPAPSRLSAEAVRAGLGRTSIQAQDRREARSVA